MRKITALAAIIVVLVILASQRTPESTDLAQSKGIVTVPEVLRTQDWEGGNIDSLAVWRPESASEEALLLITAKSYDSLLVCEAATGRLLEAVGGIRPTLEGSFQRPNGIAVTGRYAFITERNNGRVQVIELPSLKSRGTFGEGILLRPYGLSIVSGTDSVRVFVTDNSEEIDTEGHPRHLSERVKIFEVRITEESMQTDLLGSFGDTQGPGVLYKVESILADPEMNRLLVCDEYARDIKVYDLEGRFTGQIVGTGKIEVEPEGLIVATLSENPEKGVYIVTDQGEKLTVFKVFSREDFQYLGEFTGDPILANTDGIAFVPTGFGPFEKGALFAVHNDFRVQAYDWKDIQARILSREH